MFVEEDLEATPVLVGSNSEPIILDRWRTLKLGNGIIKSNIMGEPMIFIIRLQAQLHALASDPTTYTKDPDPQVLSLLSYAICSTQPKMQIKLISTCAGCPSRRLDLLPGHSGAGLEAGRDLRADDQQRPREETLQQPRPLHCASQALLGEVLLQGGSYQTWKY